MIDAKDDNTIYKTTDLGCANALSVVGFKLVSLDRSEPKRVVFIFNHERNIEDSINSYWSGSLSVDAKTYFVSLKWLKARVYNG